MKPPPRFFAALTTDDDGASLTVRLSGERDEALFEMSESDWKQAHVVILDKRRILEFADELKTLAEGMER
jgi:hypothetical protein